jgi:hypothetical protein
METLYKEIKVFTHAEFIKKISQLETKIRLCHSAGWDENTSPYSKGYKQKGEGVNIMVYKVKEQGKGMYYHFKWRSL